MKNQKLITAEIKKAIQATPYGTHDGKRGAAPVIARLFYPRGSGAFIITEGGQEPGEKWDGDTVYGYVSHGHGYEAGCFSLAEIEATKVEVKWQYGTFQVGIERDISVTPKKQTVAEVLDVRHEKHPDFWEDDTPKATPSPAPEPVAAEKPQAVQPVEYKPQAVEKPQAAKPCKPSRTRKAKPQAVEAPAPAPSPWREHVQEWRDMTHNNQHDEVRVGIAEWAAVNAPNVPEFAMIAGDFRLIASRDEHPGYDESQYMEFRVEVTDEMLERIGAAFGSEAKAGIAKCL